MMQLGGPGASLQEVPVDVSAILQPTENRYKGPIDLDEAVAQRAEELNSTWRASAGAGLHVMS